MISNLVSWLVGIIKTPVLLILLSLVIFDLGSAGKDNREFKQIATAGAATAIVVDQVWGEYVAVAPQNSTLSNAKYK